MKRVSRKRLTALAQEDGAKVVIKKKQRQAEKPAQQKPGGTEAGFDKALEGVNAAVKVIRATSELHFARAEKTDVLIEKLTERLERAPVPYKIKITKRDRNGYIEEADAIPQ